MDIPLPRAHLQKKQDKTFIENDKFVQVSTFVLHLHPGTNEIIANFALNLQMNYIIYL